MNISTLSAKTKTKTNAFAEINRVRNTDIFYMRVNFVINLSTKIFKFLFFFNIFKIKKDNLYF